MNCRVCPVYLPLFLGPVSLFADKKAPRFLFDFDRKNFSFPLAPTETPWFYHPPSSAMPASQHPLRRLLITIQTEVGIFREGDSPVAVPVADEERVCGASAYVYNSV